jgi:hypothetical protein
MPREAPVMRAVLLQAICLGLLIVDPHIWKPAIWSSRLTSGVFVIGLRRERKDFATGDSLRLSFYTETVSALLDGDADVNLGAISWIAP